MNFQEGIRRIFITFSIIFSPFAGGLFLYMTANEICKFFRRDGYEYAALLSLFGAFVIGYAISYNIFKYVGKWLSWIVRGFSEVEEKKLKP